MDPRRPQLSSYVSTFTFELNPKFQQGQLGAGSAAACERALRRTRRWDVEKMPSLANLSLQAIFKGYERPKLWGPLKALVEIQRKWRVLRHRAYWQAAYFIQQAAMYLEHGFPVPVTMAGQFSMEHIRRYRRLGSALRTSQARVHTLAITQRV